MKDQRVVIAPQPGPQEQFLSSPADIVIYGGAAGGGKTYGLLMEPLRHITNPEFDAVCFRRTSPQVTNPGGLWDTSEKLYPLLGAKANRTSMQWRFASGASVRFAHLQYETNKYDWQGSQIVLLMFDELTHFTEGQFWYLISRNRSTSGIRPYVRATTNPDADSWVAKFINWWIGPDGYPIPDRAGKVRWMARINDTLFWADSPEQLKAEHPGCEPKSVTFIPAKLEDNPALMAADPGYMANLMAQSLVERERLLGGNWKIRPEGGKVFNRQWFGIVDAAPTGGVEVDFWDFAATAKNTKGNDPDYTARVRMRKVGTKYYIIHMLAFQGDPYRVDSTFKEVSALDAADAFLARTNFKVRWEQEPGASSKILGAAYVTALDGLDARPTKPRKDKIARAIEPGGLSAQAMAGNVFLVRGEWNDEFLTHMHNQPDWPHDDIMDAAVGAYKELSAPTLQARSRQG